MDDVLCQMADSVARELNHRFNNGVTYVVEWHVCGDVYTIGIAHDGLGEPTMWLDFSNDRILIYSANSYIDYSVCYSDPKFLSNIIGKVGELLN